MNFALGMLILLVVTGGAWLVDRFFLAPARQARVKEALRQAEPKLALKPE